MTTEEAIKDIKENIKPIVGGISLDMAVEALERSKWISISERLPDDTQECLVVDANGEFGIGFYRDDAKAWDHPNWGWLERASRVDNKYAFTEPCGINKVVAWMPLPAPYKPESEV